MTQRSITNKDLQIARSYFLHAATGYDVVWVGMSGRVYAEPSQAKLGEGCDCQCAIVSRDEAFSEKHTPIIQTT